MLIRSAYLHREEIAMVRGTRVAGNEILIDKVTDPAAPFHVSLQILSDLKAPPASTSKPSVTLTDTSHRSKSYI